MSDIQQKKLTCGCLVEAEVSYDWIDQIITLDDVFILDYCPIHGVAEDLLVVAKETDRYFRSRQGYDFDYRCQEEKDLHDQACIAIAKAEGRNE